MTPTLCLLPRRAALLSGHNNTLDVLVRLRAPDRPDTPPVPPPLNLAVVIDRSGSMDGQALQEALRCARMIVSRLGPKDRLSLVVYDDSVDVLVPSTPVRDPELFYTALSSVVSGGRTDLHSGWLAGAEQVAPHIQPGTVSRVLLLSDGRANVGLTSRDELTAQCHMLAERGVSTSTYGLGRHFHEELMGDMARSGEGNSYYGQTAEDLADPFSEELDLLANLCARRVRLVASPGQDIQMVCRNGYAETPEGRKLPDLAYGGETWAMLQLTIPRAVVDAPTASPLLFASVSWETMSGEVQHSTIRTIQLPGLPPAAFEAVSEDPTVRQRAEELDAARYQTRIRAAAHAGDWRQVDVLLAEARTRAANNRWILSTLDTLERYARRRETLYLKKEAYYSSRKMRSRIISRMESEDWSDEDDLPSFLRRKREQGRRG